MRSARLHVMCEMHHEYIHGCEAAMLSGTYSAQAVSAVDELQGVHSVESRKKYFAMGS